jgi:hypothetical protein
MAKPKPQALSYSMQLIELEKLNVLKRTDACTCCESPKRGTFSTEVRFYYPARSLCVAIIGVHWVDRLYQM